MNAMENWNDEENINEDIIIMRNVKQMMNKETCLKINEYKNIYKLVQEYLKKNCNHIIIKDYIDISPDETKDIYYCSHCYLMENEIH
jgi:hypothetical protein